MENGQLQSRLRCEAEKLNEKFQREFSAINSSGKNPEQVPQESGIQREMLQLKE